MRSWPWSRRRTAFLRHVRFGRDGAESTTRAYAGAIALFLRWCARTGRDWQAGVGQLGLFMTWLRHAGPQGRGIEAVPGAVVLAGPGHAPARSARRVNGVLAAVRGMAGARGRGGDGAAGAWCRCCTRSPMTGTCPGGRAARTGGWRGGCGPGTGCGSRRRPVDRASDEEIVALLRACCSARDRLIVLLMARAGLRRGEVLGLRRSDVHLLPDSRALGCAVAGAHLHVVRRRGNPNGAWAKSRRQRAVPLDFLVVQAFDTYEFERMAVPAAAGSDFVLVNLFRGPLGAPMRPDAVNELVAAAGAAGRAGPGRHAASAAARVRVERR